MRRISHLHVSKSSIAYTETFFYFNSLLYEYRTQMLQPFTVESLVFPGICLVNLMSLQTFLSFALKCPFVQTFPPAKFDTRVTFAIFLSFPRRPALHERPKNICTLYRKRSDGHKRLFSLVSKAKKSVKSNMRSWNVSSSSLMSGSRHQLSPI